MILGWFCLIPSCHDDIVGCCGVAAGRGGIMILQVPRGALEFARMSINLHFENSGTPYVLFLVKVMLKFSMNFSMNLLKIGHMGYLRLMPVIMHVL